MQFNDFFLSHRVNVFEELSTMETPIAEEKKWMTVHGKTTCPITIQTSPCPQTKKMVIIYIFLNYTLTLFITRGGYFYPFLILGAPNDDGPITIHNSSCPSTKKKIEKQFRKTFLQSLKILCFKLHFRFHYEMTMQAIWLPLKSIF